MGAGEAIKLFVSLWYIHTVTNHKALKGKSGKPTQQGVSTTPGGPTGKGRGTGSLGAVFLLGGHGRGGWEKEAEEEGLSRAESYPSALSPQALLASEECSEEASLTGGHSLTQRACQAEHKPPLPRQAWLSLS